jgi:hypothetical protein
MATVRDLNNFDDERRMRRFYEILLEADLTCLSSALERRRKRRQK